MKVKSCGRNCIWVEIATALKISVSLCTRAAAPVAEIPIASATIRIARHVQFQELEAEHAQMRIEESQRHLRQPFVIVPRHVDRGVGVSVEARDVAGAQRRLRR